MQTEVAPSLDAWNAQVAAGSSVTLEQLEGLIKEYRAKREEAEKFRVEKTRIEKEFAELEGRLIEAMQQMGKGKVYVEGAGTLYFIDKFVVPTPKTNADKVKFFDWIKKEYGDTVLLEKVSVNHQTLQSMYNNALKEYQEKCEKEGNPELGATFSIPGLQAPTNQRSLGFRKEK